MVGSTISKEICLVNKSLINSRTSVNLGEGSPSRSELKSSIPKPTPPRSRTSVHSKSSSSSQIRLTRLLQSSEIPKPLFRSLDREKTCLSLQATPRLPLGKYESSKNQTNCHVRPRSASLYRGPHSNVKAKVNSKPPSITTLKSPLNERLAVKSDSSAVDDNAETTDKSKKTTVGEKKVSNDQVLEKQQKPLNIRPSELVKLQSPKEIQPLEKEICRLMQDKTLDDIGNLMVENTPTLPEGAPVFLIQFGKQMQGVKDSWLRLTCEVTNTLLTGNPNMTNVVFSTDALNMRDELNNFFSSLSSQGESLQTTLQKIENDFSKTMEEVIHSSIVLSQKNEELKDNYFRLEKTQDQMNFELKEQIAILGKENEILDRKYKMAVEKYNMERPAIEGLEKQISKENIEVRKLIKFLETKCQEFEVKTKKGETACRALETLIRNKEVMFVKENKNHRELQNKFNNSNDTIKALQNQLSDSSQAKSTLEIANQNLQDELKNKKAELMALKEKISQAEEELTIKNKKLNDAQKELDEIQTHFSRTTQGVNETKNLHDISLKVMIDDLSKENDQKALQIQELRKKLSKIEHILQEKSIKEENLLAQVADLKKQPFEKEVLLHKQIQDLKFELKGVKEVKEKLEKMAAQKSLELDLRDLLMRDHDHVLRVKDELIPMFQSHQRNEKDYIEKLSAIVIEQHKTYFNKKNGTGSDDKTNIREIIDAWENPNSLDPEKVNQELSFRQEKMCDLYDLMEHKQMEMLRLEQRMNELQGVREEMEHMEREKEARIHLLQREVEERKNGKSWGFFSIFFGQNK